MLLKSQNKHIAAAYAASQELYKKQVLVQELPMSAITGGQSVTPASSEYDGDDTSEEPLPPPPRTPPEKPPTCGRTRQQDTLHRGRMRPMSAGKSGDGGGGAAAA